MNLTWHIIKKDLRRFWLPIALMAMVVIAKAFFFNVVVHEKFSAPAALNGMSAITAINDREWTLHGDDVNWLVAIICATDFVILVILVIGALYEDPTMGEKTFWRTRPIAGWRMLAAKMAWLFLIACPLLGILQVATNIHLMTLAHAHPEYTTVIHWYDSLGTLILVQAAWVGVVGFVPLLWRNPLVGGFMMFIVYIACGFIISFLFNVLKIVKVLPVEGLLPAMLAILFCTYGAVAWWMYCKQRRAIGFLIFGAGLLAEILAVVF